MQSQQLVVVPLPLPASMERIKVAARRRPSPAAVALQMRINQRRRNVLLQISVRYPQRRQPPYLLSLLHAALSSRLSIDSFAELCRR